jgi:hypothetical protein
MERLCYTKHRCFILKRYRGWDEVRQSKKRVKQPSITQVEDAIRKAAGNVTAAAEGLGIGRTSLHRRIAKSARLQEILQEEREALVDMAESALREEVKARNMTAVIWTLKANPEAKKRGWGERQELTGADGNDVTIRVVYGDDGPDG